ncbi:MAG: hypothetical protein DRI90_19750 [Deltaproteobacteria bacterium]|nr:MAG: hypothetical protein DRI90_19750 [Deltaproteobacteria bacterium]
MGRLSPEQQALVVSNARVAQLVTRRGAYKYRNLLSQDEIEQVAQLALVKAAMTYQRETGVPFSGFAWSHVAGAVIRHADKERRARQLRAALGKFMKLAMRQGSVLTDTPETVRVEAIEQLQCGLIATTLGMVADAREGTDEPLICRETIDAVAQAVAELDAEQRTVVEQVYFEDRQLKQVAAACGWTVITTRRRHQAALTELARKLGQHAAEPAARLPA